MVITSHLHGIRQNMVRLILDFSMLTRERLKTGLLVDGMLKVMHHNSIDIQVLLTGQSAIPLKPLNLLKLVILYQLYVSNGLIS
jgi:hypothetical protein